jgi:hypothetical protein
LAGKVAVRGCDPLPTVLIQRPGHDGEALRFIRLSHVLVEFLVDAFGHFGHGFPSQGQNACGFKGLQTISLLFSLCFLLGRAAMNAPIEEFRMNADGCLEAARTTEGPLREQYLMLVAEWDRLAREYARVFEGLGMPHGDKR